MQERDFAVNDARQVCAVAHDPSDAVSASREFGPLARLLRVLFDEHRAVRQFDVAHAGVAKATDASTAAEEFFKRDEYDARLGYVFVGALAFLSSAFRHVPSAFALNLLFQPSTLRS